MNFILNFTLLLYAGTSIAGKTSLANSYHRNCHQKNATNPDSSLKALIGVWKLSDNEKHENPLPVKKLIISATEISFYTENKIVFKTKYSVSTDTLLKKPSNNLSLLINLVDIYEQWTCQVLVPQNFSTHSHKETISLLLMQDPVCKCSCPYEIYTPEEKTGSVKNQKDSK